MATVTYNRLISTFKTGSISIDADVVEAGPVKIQERGYRSVIQALNTTTPIVKTGRVYLCYAYIESLPKAWQPFLKSAMTIRAVHINTSTGAHKLSEVIILDYDSTQKLITFLASRFS